MTRHRPDFVTASPFLNRITLPLTQKGREPTTDARTDLPAISTGEASGSATPSHPPVAALDSKKHRPAWITDNKVLEQTTRGFTGKGKEQAELLTLLNLWNIDPVFVSPENADEVAKALKTFTYKPVVGDAKGKNKEKLEKRSNIGDLANSARVAFETGNRDSIDAYVTLAGMGIVEPNASARPGDSLLERLVAQPNKGKAPVTALRQEAGPSNAAPAIAQAYSPQQRLAILFDLGADPEKSKVTGGDLVRMAEKAGNGDLTRGLMPYVKKSEQEPKWYEWALHGHGSKAVAVERMKTWVAAGDPDRPLDLSGLELRSLPEVLPAGLRHFVVSNNQLTYLKVPEGVKTVDASDNRLETLRLSTGVKTVNVNNNRLQTLDLPKGLRTLDISDNRVEGLKLHEGLKLLNIANNRFQELADTPTTLKRLDFSGNQLRSPPRCHDALEIFRANKNKLTSLPLEKKGLKEVVVDGNRLTTLPLYWSELETVSIKDNRLTATQLDEYGIERM